MIRIYTFLSFAFLFFCSTAVYPKVIFRTVSYNVPANNFMDDLEVRQLFMPSSPTTFHFKILFNIDINQDGSNDFNYGWHWYRGVSENQTCSEGTLARTTAWKNWILQSSTVRFSETVTSSQLVGASTSPFFFSDATTPGKYIGWYWKYVYDNPCNGEYITTPSSIINNGVTNFPNIPTGTFYIGFRFSIGANSHYGWLKFNGTQIVEIAYEDLPNVPIRPGSHNGIFDSTTDPDYNTISGLVYNDVNGNCTKDASETGVAAVPVKVKNSNYFAFTDASGKFELMLPGTTTIHELEVEYYPEHGYTVDCTLPAVSFTGGDQRSTDNNIPVKFNSCPDLRTYVSSNMRRRCFRSKTSVNYENRSNSIVAGVSVYVVLPEYIYPISSVPAWTQKIGDTLVYSIGSLNGLEKGSIAITDSVVCNIEEIRGLTQCTKAYIVPNSYCSNGSLWSGADIHIKGACEESVFKAELLNKGASNMSDSSEYRIYFNNTLVRKAKYRLAAGESLSLNLPTNGYSLRIEADQVSDHPNASSYRALVFEGCGNFSTQTISKGYGTGLPFNVNGFNESVSCMNIVDSYDPNDKLALPASDDGLVLPNQDITYTIRFQNTGTASAVNIVVVDTLDAKLNPATIKIISASHSYQYYITGSGCTRMTFYFNNINLPAKTLSESGSQGYITFKISQYADLPLGEEIKNKAYIFFDFNSPIITNETVQTVGIPVTDQLLYVSQQVNDLAACSGTNATIQLGAHGVVEYQWFKDNTLLPEETSEALSLTNLALVNEGDYFCRIVGMLDTLYSDTVFVDVAESPSLQIFDQLICEEAGANLPELVEDNNSTTGSITYWSNLELTSEVSNPADVTVEGTYYIHKITGEGCSDTVAVFLQVVEGLCSGVMDAKDAGVKIYPNPVAEYVVIENTRSFDNIEFYNQHGKLLQVKTLAAGVNKIETTEMPEGVIYVKISGEDLVVTDKIVKK